MRTSSGLAPRVVEQAIDTDAIDAASNREYPGFRAPFAGVVTSVTYVPADTITGAETNYRVLQVFNRGADGAGTTAIAELAFSTTAVVATALDEKAITLSGTAANLDVAKGDIVSFLSTHVGTGLADPGGTVRIKFSRD